MGPGGLLSGLSLRIALHAGPVYKFTDPVTGDRSYEGTHVSRAARIEPITPPGQVYASEAFAALAAAQRATSFELDYAGQTPMAKNYGTFPAYHVRRMRSAQKTFAALEADHEIRPLHSSSPMITVMRKHHKV